MVTYKRLEQEKVKSCFDFLEIDIVNGKLSIIRWKTE